LCSVVNCFLSSSDMLWTNVNMLTNVTTKATFAKFYIHGSVHRESNLLIVQQDATYSVYYISVGSSTCFGC